jgi:hypothetical protein
MKLIKKKNCVEVTAVGGLGNQLFCYAAGLYLAEKTKTRLVVNVSQIGVGSVDHGKTIINFDLDCEFRNSSQVGDVRSNFLLRSRRMGDYARGTRHSFLLHMCRF